MRHSGPLARLGLSLALAVGFCAPGLGQGDPHGLLRSASGTIHYRTLNEKAPRATEQWTLMVHSDGTRTLNTRILNRDAVSRTTIVQRVAADFRPLDTFVERWVGADYQAIGLFSRRGGQITGLSRSSAGEHSHEVDVPADVTLISHALAADAWQVVPPDLELGQTFQMTAYSIEFAANASVPLLGAILRAPLQWIGRETITVPAGRFDTTHMRLAERFDVWFFGPDRTLARMVHEELGREYVLTEYDGPR